MPRVLCIGDSSINVFLQIPAGAENVTVDEIDRLMNFRLGSKTQLEKETITFGGNALNVAIGLVRAGIEVDFCSIVGNDIDGERVVQFLFNEGEVLQQKTGKNLLKFNNVKQQTVKTNVGYVVNFMSERFLLIDTSSKSYEIPSSQSFDGEPWVFLSSIGPGYEVFFEEFIPLKKEKGFRSAYNPSSNELKKPVATYLEMIKTSDVLFVNKKEAGKILKRDVNEINRKEENDSSGSVLSVHGAYVNQEIHNLLSGLFDLNHGIVVVTDGIRGSYVFDGKELYFESSDGIEAVEKTGAGDAYESGFLAEYLKTGDIQAAMKSGTENAGSVIQHIGAIEGLQYKI